MDLSIFNEPCPYCGEIFDVFEGRFMLEFHKATKHWIE